MSSSVSLKRWQLLSPPEQAAVLGLAVTLEQIEFAGTVERSVESCKADQDNQIAGLAILENQAVAGLLVLKRGASAPSWASPSAATVSAMRIDVSCQGKGIGSAALQALPSWVAENWPESPLLVLSVDEENQSARSAYAKAGFVDHGTMRAGPNWLGSLHVQASWWFRMKRRPNPSVKGTCLRQAPYVER